MGFRKNITCNCFDHRSSGNIQWSPGLWYCPCVQLEIITVCCIDNWIDKRTRWLISTYLTNILFFFLSSLDSFRMGQGIRDAESVCHRSGCHRSMSRGRGKQCVCIHSGSWLGTQYCHDIHQYYSLIRYVWWSFLWLTNTFNNIW